jgi:hypothetical protein
MPPCSSLKIEKSSLEVLVFIYQTTRRNISGDSNLNSHLIFGISLDSISAQSQISGYVFFVFLSHFVHTTRFLGTNSTFPDSRLRRSVHLQIDTIVLEEPPAAIFRVENAK